jgi:multicomponent Na+:H+ antiporter subunit A
MVAGTLDHETGTRDVEKLGGLRRAMPITALVGGLAAISLAGVGPLFSFIGKEMLFEAVLHSENQRLLLIIASVIGGAFFVAVAAIVGIKPFFGEARATPKAAHEAPLSMLLGPAILATLGIVLGLMPKIVGALISSTASAISGREQVVKLSLWHGFNAALGMSAASLLVGLLAYAAWATVRRTHARWERVLGWGPARWYEWGLRALDWTARAQTCALQNGSLRSYVMMTIVTATALTGTALLVREGLHPTVAWEDTRFYEAGLAVLILLAAFTALRSRSRLAAIAALGVVGYCVALLYLFFGAPDLAMTQVLVDTLTVILFVLVFHHLPHFARLSSSAARVRDAVIALSFGALMTALVLTTNNVQFHEPISKYFAEQSVPKGHGHNIVNVILVDFRALDTLGEIVVLALAGIGVYSLLRLRLHPPPEGITSRGGDT